SHLLCCSTCSLFLTDPATTDIYTLSLHDALPILDSHLSGAIVLTVQVFLSESVSHDGTHGRVNLPAAILARLPNRHSIVVRRVSLGVTDMRSQRLVTVVRQLVL